MRRTGLLLVASVLAGCLGAPASPPAPGAPTQLLAPPGQALWHDPQFFPHPAFGWPTLTHVPANAPAWWQPIPGRALPQPVGGLEHVAHLEGSHGSERIAVFGRLAVVPRVSEVGGTDEVRARTVTVVGLEDPAAPEILATFDPGIPTVDAALVPYPDGRLLAVLATLSEVLPVWDLTDPRAPRELAPIPLAAPSHNIGVVPGTPILYNGNAAGGGREGSVPGRGSGFTDIYDLTDPSAPVLVQEWPNGYGCHTTTFFIEPARAKYRAYCAGYEATQIWDIADPRKPRVLATIPTHHDNPALPGVAAFPARVATMTLVNADATTLVVSDEGGIIVPGCEAYARSAGRTVASPHGALWFYDITDEARPALRGWLTPGPHALQNDPPPRPFFTPVDVGACAAHYAHLVPDPARDLLVAAFFQGGVVLVDFTDPAAPFLVDQWSAQALTDDAWYAQGYVIAAHWDRGLDVLTFTGAP